MKFLLLLNEKCKFLNLNDKNFEMFHHKLPRITDSSKLEELLNYQNQFRVFLQKHAKEILHLFAN